MFPNGRLLIDCSLLWRAIGTLPAPYALAWWASSAGGAVLCSEHPPNLAPNQCTSCEIDMKLNHRGQQEAGDAGQEQLPNGFDPGCTFCLDIPRGTHTRG